jgi:hypothetical protein
MSQPEKKQEIGFTDSVGCELIIIEGGGDTTVRPTDPRLREEIERRMRQWQDWKQQHPSDAKPENGSPSA